MRTAGIALAAVLAGCAAAPAPAAREHPTIVSLNPCTDAILAEVAEPDQVLAISHYSYDPRASSMPIAVARRYRAVGDTAEEVLVLAPDIVVASTYMPPATAQSFSRLGLRVEAFGIARTVAESEDQVRRLAALAGHPERGATLIARIEAARVASRSSGPPVTALLWQQGGLVAGPDSLVAQLLAESGFASHAAARGLGQGAYLPLERVLADPPQVILAAGAERMLTHPALRALPGVRYARLDPALLYCGGPTIERTAARLAQIRRGHT